MLWKIFSKTFLREVSSSINLSMTNSPSIRWPRRPRAGTSWPGGRHPRPGGGSAAARAAAASGWRRGASAGAGSGPSPARAAAATSAGWMMRTRTDTVVETVNYQVSCWDVKYFWMLGKYFCYLLTIFCVISEVISLFEVQVSSVSDVSDLSL